MKGFAELDAYAIKKAELELVQQRLAACTTLPPSEQRTAAMRRLEGKLLALMDSGDEAEAPPEAANAGSGPGRAVESGADGEEVEESGAGEDGGGSVGSGSGASFAQEEQGEPPGEEELEGSFDQDAVSNDS